MSNRIRNETVAEIVVRACQLYFEPLHGFFDSKFAHSVSGGNQTRYKGGDDAFSDATVARGRYDQDRAEVSGAAESRRKGMFELVESKRVRAIVKVVGVGGGGCNSVMHLAANYVDGVELICVNTDSEALAGCSAVSSLNIGDLVTKGLGAGGNPEVGRQAAIEDRDRIREILVGADLVFITAGMGGGTGTGAAPVIAQLSKDMGILTVAVVTKPFPFEGQRRLDSAQEGIEALSQHVDNLIIIPNEKLLTVLGREVSLLNAFRAANDVLLGTVRGVSELLMHPGLINVDLADMRSVMSEMGMATMGTGTASGDERAAAAVEAAMNNPLLEHINLSGACGVLVNITAGMNLSMKEFDEVGRTIVEFASKDATVVIGTVLDPDMQTELRVTVLATGLNRAIAREGAVRMSTESTSVKSADSAKIDIQTFLRRQAD